MRSLNFYQEIVKQFTIIIIAGLIFANCNKSDDDSPQSPKQTPLPTVTIEEIDKTMFGQIKYASENSNAVWNGFKFSSYPKYFFYRENESSKPLRGFIIDPPGTVSKSIKIPDNIFKGLNLFRYDNQLSDANKKLLEGVNKIYEFDYKIDNINYFLSSYNSNTVNKKDTIFSILGLSVHEIFHIYQEENWTSISGSLQDEANYPINKQILPLQLLTIEIAKKMPAETNLSNIDKYLSMYVAIRSEEMELDITIKKLVKNMANSQETEEGTAYYVQYEIEKEIFSKNPTSYVFVFNWDKISSKKSEVRQYFAWNIWDETGASVTYMLNKKGVNVSKQAANGKTLYQIADEALNLTDAQKASFLEQAKTEFNYETIVEKANELLALE